MLSNVFFFALVLLVLAFAIAAVTATLQRAGRNRRPEAANSRAAEAEQEPATQAP